MHIASAATCAVRAAAVVARVNGVAIVAGSTNVLISDCRAGWRYIACSDEFAHAGVAAIEYQWHAVRCAHRWHNVAGNNASAAAWRRWQFAQVGTCVGVHQVGVIALFAFAGVDNAVATLFIRFAVFRTTVAVDRVAVIADFANVNRAVAATGGRARNAGVGTEVAFFVGGAVGIFGALVGVRYA